MLPSTFIVTKSLKRSPMGVSAGLWQVNIDPTQSEHTLSFALV